MSEDLMRLETVDVATFAAASGDRNPLYLDEGFARRTSSGRCVLPGVLAVIAALAAVPRERVRAAGGLTARFARPLFPGRDYRTGVVSKDGGVTSVVVREGGLPVLSFDLTSGAAFGESVRPVALAVPERPDEPAGLDRGERLSGMYGVASPSVLRELADRLGAAHVPDALLGALAWSSWFVGMRAPGRDALFSSLRLRTADGPPERGDPRYVATVTAADDRTGALVVGVACTGDGTAVEAELRAFRRRTVPPPTRESATSVLPAGERLAGKNVLAVGGSRGIGAATVSVLAAQGATVWVTQRSPGPVEALRREFGADRVRPLVLDAEAADQVRAGMAELSGAGVRLDGLVLSAGPAVLPSNLHPDSVDTIRQLADTSLTLALRPLSGALDLLDPGAWVVFLSSGAVEDVPEHHLAYFVAKNAVEALGRYCARWHGLRVLLARAPKMWTDLSNGPLGGRGTVPTAQVASAILGWILEDAGPGVTVLGPDSLASWAPRHEPAGRPG